MMWATSFYAAVLLKSILLITHATGSAIEGEPFDHQGTELLPRETKCTEISPPPSEEVCGKFGKLGEKLPESISYAPNVANCRDLCAVRSKSPDQRNKPGCLAFAYEAATGHCKIYDLTLEYLRFRQTSNSSTQFYSLRCFHCPNECPHPIGVNIVDNGGFEISDRLIGPWYVYNPGNKVVTPGHGSKHAAKVKRYISQYTNICRAQKYSFSADYMISGPAPTRDTNVTVRLKAGQLDFIKLYRLTNSSGFNRFDKWNTVRGTLGAYSPDYAPYNAIQFAASVSARDEKMALHDTYTLYVDNFVVKPTKAIFETVGEDALINGGFESGALNPWLVSPQKHSYDVSDGIVHQGLTNGSNYSFRYHAPEYEFGGSTAYYGYDTGGFVLQQNFTAVPGRQYLLSFNYRAAFINQIVVAVFDAHDAPQGYDGVNYVPGEEIPRSHFAWTIFGLSEFRLYGMDGNGAPTNNKLASFSRVFQAMSHKSTLSLSFTGTGYGDRSIETVRIDNVSILALADGRNL